MRALRQVALAIPAVLLLIVYIGDQFREPLVTAPIFFALLAALAIAVTRRPAQQGATEQEFERRLWARGPVAWWIRGAAVAAGGLLLVLLSGREYQHMVLYPERGAFLWIAVAAAGLGLALLLVRPPRPLISLGVLTMAGLAIRACGMAQWEIDPVRRDMLPLVVSALDSLLDGHNPYQLYQMQVGSQVPLTYPPGLWLLHLPTHALGLDVRWTAWLADLAILGAIGTAAVRLRGAFGPVFLGLAVYLFLPDTHWNGIYAEPNADWAVLAWLAAAALHRKPLAVGVLAGVALTTRPFNLVLLPFVVIWLVRSRGWRTAWRAVVAAGLVAAAAYLPFVLTSPDGFFAGTVRWLLDYGPAHHTWFYGMLSFSGPMYEHGLEAWMTPLQGVSLVVLVGLAAWKLRTERGLLLLATFAYALFVAFNSIVWMSFWIGVCLLALAAVAASGSAGDERPASPASRSRIWLLFEIAGSLAVVAALAVMVGLLARHFDEEGRDEVRRDIAADARPGDVILDRSGYRVSFMRAPWIFGREDLPGGVALAGDPFVAELPRRSLLESGGAERVWVVERYGLFAEHAALYLGKRNDGTYRLADEREVGRYRLLRLERRAAAPKGSLVAWFERLEVSADLGGRVLEAERDGAAWRFRGRPKWEHVAVTPCRIESARRPMLWAHPVEGGILRIELPLEEGIRHVTVVGGLVDKAPQWGRATVDLELRAGEREIGALRFPNAPGLRGASFAIPAGTDRLAFELSASDVSRRHFCLDAVFGE